jgi:hypothetical protein
MRVAYANVSDLVENDITHLRLACYGGQRSGDRNRVCCKIGAPGAPLRVIEAKLPSGRAIRAHKSVREFFDFSELHATYSSGKAHEKAGLPE